MTNAEKAEIILLITPLDAVKRDAYASALRLAKGDVDLAAKGLGVGRASMYRAVKKYGLKLNGRSKPKRKPKRKPERKPEPVPVVAKKDLNHVPVGDPVPPKRISEPVEVPVKKPPAGLTASGVLSELYGQ